MFFGERCCMNFWIVSWAAMIFFLRSLTLCHSAIGDVGIEAGRNSTISNSCESGGRESCGPQRGEICLGLDWMGLELK